MKLLHMIFFGVFGVPIAIALGSFLFSGLGAAVRVTRIRHLQDSRRHE
jgi:hypothetical protein